MKCNDIISMPVKAKYRIIDGEPILISAEYADVSADVVARFLLDAFNVHASKEHAHTTSGAVMP